MENQDEAWLLKEKYHGQKTEGFLTDCKRLKTGEPLAYVIGHVPFLGTTTQLSSSPLIPRPETEYWVEKAIETLRTTPYQGETLIKVLDLCAGSGCIGVAVGAHVPNAHITFSEIDREHLPTIKKNCAGNDITHYSSRTSDLFSNIEGTFDFILSNPPYIDPALDRTQASVKCFEPHLALYGGKDGSEVIERIIKEAPLRLNPGGQLWLEHEPEQTELIASLGIDNGFSVSTHPDQYGILRYSVLELA
ncbi:peptide chain release factor N(5)-glutamine methyltransferase [Patescibacteria group bacterium]|nr:peptide chain release factor N(5)-glutamine methyltransferase [Patescibacteria group bacterium]